MSLAFHFCKSKVLFVGRRNWTLGRQVDVLVSEGKKGVGICRCRYIFLMQKKDIESVNVEETWNFCEFW